MTHFVDAFADRVNDILHDFFGTCFFKQEILEVPGLLTGLLITYDGLETTVAKRVIACRGRSF
jgi:hypothetical protein